MNWEDLKELPDGPEKGRAIVDVALEQSDQYIKWHKTNSVAAEAAEKEAQATLAMTHTFLIKEHPEIIKYTKAISEAMVMILDFGFYLGRKYQDVPEVFKKGFK